MSPVSALFQPLRVGTIDLQHRVVMAPLTRIRADKDHVHGELAKTYYTQRSSVPGTLIISEATFIAPQAAGYTNVPGIWNAAQIAGWKSITDAVHANGSFKFIPSDVLLILLCSSGKVASISLPPALSLSLSHGHSGDGELVIPHELTTAELKEYV